MCLLKYCTVATVQTQSNWHTNSSHDLVENPRPSLSTALHPGGPCEPLLLVAKTDRRKKVDNLFNPFMNALVLSRGDIEKMFPAFPEQSAKKRGPWEVFYPDDTKFCTHKLQFLWKRHLCPIFRSRSLLSYSLGWYYLKGCNVENETW